MVTSTVTWVKLLNWFIRVIMGIIRSVLTGETRGAESESESPGVVAASQGSESESTKLPRLRLWNVSFASVINLPIQVRICKYFLEIKSADVFKLCRYLYICQYKAMAFKGGSKGAKRGHAPKVPENGTKSTDSSR